MGIIRWGYKWNAPGLRVGKRARFNLKIASVVGRGGRAVESEISQPMPMVMPTQKQKGWEGGGKNHQAQY